MYRVEASITDHSRDSTLSLEKYKGHFTHETRSPWPLHFKYSHWWKGWSRSKFTSHYTWGTNGACECKMDVKSTWIPTWHRMDHVFMVTWTTLKNYVLEVGLTQNRQTTALHTLTTADLFYFIMCEDPHEWKFIDIAFGWGLGHIWLHTTLEGPWPHYMILEVSWDSRWTLSFGLSHYTRESMTTLHDFGDVLDGHWTLSFGLSHYTRESMTTLHDFGDVLDGHWTLSFGLSQSHGHGSWLVCEVALRQWK